LKAIVIITIVVICSVVAVLGILNFSSSIEDEKTRVFEIDLADADQIQSQYNQIMDELCLDEPLPDSFKELSELTDKLELNLQKINEKTDKMKELKTKMDLLYSKYTSTSESNYFVLHDQSCPHNEELTKLKDVENNPVKYEKYADSDYITLYWNLDECVVNFKEKNLGEKYIFEPCIEKLQPKVEFFCSKYSQENCIKTTNQELLDWLNRRYPNGVHPLNSWNLPK